MADLSNLMKEAQKMQERMQQAQNELTEMVVVGEAGGGMVKVKMNGRHQALEVTIDDSLLDEDVSDSSMLQDLVLAAINSATDRVEKKSQEKIRQLTAGLNIPQDFMKDEGKE
ncbi:YbaB/EbfC family nucleoid-associated protein [Legionella sp. W05-934-2]|jgi:DNA-binding YbaB/EbfC family protein|uniref:YbaB/EbfC family nucleoid-associated protein n=1 Tax=Legionella sp. W05-934-2 TaxID=1198649 RepID=UPI003461B350